MKTKVNYLQVPTVAVIFFALLLVVTSFYSGVSWVKSKSTTSTTTATPTVNATNAITLPVVKSDRPELKFFVMSFCPYGNQMEDLLKPIVDLLGNKADITPHYIFDKIADLNSYCKSRSGDPAQCATYVTNKYFKTEAECKTTIAQNTKTCLDEKSYIKTSDGSFYASLHGRIEANQDVREICAWNQVSDKKTWWSFVDNVNKNCTAQNADTCWEEQAKKAGVDTAKVTECFNKETMTLIEKEIALTDQYKVSGSPTLLLGNNLFPPDTAYTQDGKGALKIGKKVIPQSEYRTPNAIKEAICASFNKPPKECNTTLAAPATAAAPAAGCN